MKSHILALSCGETEASGLVQSPVAVFEMHCRKTLDADVLKSPVFIWGDFEICVLLLGLSPALRKASVLKGYIKQESVFLIILVKSIC